MFDIKEYYNNFKPNEVRNNIIKIEDDINDDIDNLLNNRFEKLYTRDKYKYSKYSIDIINPILNYNGNKSVLTTPDKIRYLLSFYPQKNDFENIEKIVLRPKYIEMGNVELSSLYLRRKKIIVLYLIHPYLYKINNPKFNQYSDFLSLDLGKLMDNNFENNSYNKNSDVYIHPLWYILSNIKHQDDNTIDKFLIKRDKVNNKTYETLNDVSFFFTRHGY